MKETKNEKPEVMVYDFTKVTMETKFDEYEEIDLSKPLANNIHQNTGDIGLDEIARTIYKEGKAEIPNEYVPAILNILSGNGTTLVVAAKKAIIELLTLKK